ncbi:hypothetical protein PISL3812_01624 [Talaromyces islandicus]|uniref:NECAP PHear domain-containing protein n=1 Tax=Talaromyces islandicus TaxID=28573 RepID=A0A0U1LPC5_TALIS|nr:hypothetical protein PISL3812_01624 [Talaromyces islandicus]
MAVNPATGAPLPADALQRVLFVARTIHVYAIPPLTSMKGYMAADWTVQNRQIFTGRLRILETAVHDTVTTDILLEDPNDGSLFAAAPYTDPGAVEHVLDSSRFFVLRVVGEGRKATLGIGFEDRSDAFDFGVALQEARKLTASSSSNPASSASEQTTEAPKDYSLKPGQTISVNTTRRRPAADLSESKSPISAARAEEQALFSIPPPPTPTAGASIAIGDQGGGGGGRRRRPASALIAAENAPSLGFDDSATFN